nr:cell division protein FtsN [uncultured Haemophilus sp.]
MARKKKSRGMSVSTILSIVIIILLVSGLGLWIMKENAPTQTIPTPNQVAVKPVPTTTLPSRPEEVYSYIRDLETREVVSDPNKGLPKSAQLSKEQLKQLEEKRKQEEAARLAAEQPAQPEVPTETTEVVEPTQQVAPSEAELAAQKAREQKALEEKRKQAELKKQQDLAKKEAEKAKAEKAKADQAKAEQAKTEQAKATSTTSAKTEEKQTASQPKPGSFGLQCGAFKNKAQAENMQARLAMAGFNARIVSGADWNRVFVGPVGNRAAAATAQSNARSVAECVIVAM